MRSEMDDVADKRNAKYLGETSDGKTKWVIVVFIRNYKDI